MKSSLARERLEEFLASIGNKCTVTEESSNYFILACTKKGKYEVQKKIVEELGFPASIIGKHEIYVYRVKPEAKVRVEVSYDSVRERVLPDDRESVIEYNAPEVCLRGATYPIKDLVKEYGFKFDPLRKEWCRIFDTFSDLTEFLRNGLPQLVSDAARKGVAIEVNMDELEKEIDELRNRLRRTNESHLKSFITLYAYTKLSPDIVAYAARIVGDSSCAKLAEDISSAFDDFGDSVDVFASIHQRTVLICAKPRKYLGKEQFKTFIRRAESLGLKKVANYIFCTRIGAELVTEVLSNAIISFVFAETSQEQENAIKQIVEKIKSKNIEVSESDIVELVNKLRTNFANIVNKAKSLIYKTLS